MDYQTMSDRAIAKELGGRIKSRRLRLNKTQEEVAARSGLSVTAVKNIEAGKGRISSLLAVLRDLNALADLNAFMQPEPVSPLQRIRMKGKTRKRASPATKKDTAPFNSASAGHYTIHDGRIVPAEKDDSEW